MLLPLLLLPLRAQTLTICYVAAAAAVVVVLSSSVAAAAAVVFDWAILANDC